MKVSELRQMSDEQLAQVLKETRDALFRLRVRAQTERLDAPSEVRKMKKLIARIVTIQNERKRAQERLAAQAG